MNIFNLAVHRSGIETCYLTDNVIIDRVVNDLVGTSFKVPITPSQSSVALSYRQVYRSGTEVLEDRKLWKLSHV